MFAVLETLTTPPQRWRRRSGYSAAVCEKPRYVGVTLELPLGARDKELKKRILFALRRIAQAGLKGIVLPKDFPFPELPGALGLAVSSPVPLLRRLAAPLCRFAVGAAGVPWGRVRLTFAGRRGTPELLAAAGALAAAAKAVHIDAGEDGEAVCYLLRRHYGVAAVNRPAKASEGFWDVYILFEPTGRRMDLHDNAFVLNLTGGAPALSGGHVANGALLTPPRTMRKGWPDNCDDAAMLAALLATGQVTPREIGIRALTHGDRILTLS